MKKHTETTTRSTTLKAVGRMAAAFGLVMALGACGNLVEQAYEFGLEQAIEAEHGEDVNIDLDFSGESGGITIEGENGEFFDLSVSADGVNIEGSDESGDFSITGDEEGIVFNGPDGEEGTVDFTDDGFVVNTDEGEGVVTLGDNGLTIETDDGTAVFGAADLPANWPGLIGSPDNVDANESYFTASVTDGRIQVIAFFAHDPGQDWTAEVADRLVSNGFTVETTYENVQGSGQSLVRGDERVELVNLGDGTSTVSANLNV